MAVDLTPGQQTKGLRAAVIALREERDDLRQQVSNLPELYEELYVRDEQIAELEAKVERLEGRGISDMQATIDAYEEALSKIVSANGRGALKIARQALVS